MKDFLGDIECKAQLMESAFNGARTPPWLKRSTSLLVREAATFELSRTATSLLRCGRSCAGLFAAEPKNWSVVADDDTPTPTLAIIEVTRVVSIGVGFEQMIPTRGRRVTKSKVWCLGSSWGSVSQLYN